VGYLLRRMIRDGAPPGWSPLMRLVAGEIADDARDPEESPGVLVPPSAWPSPGPYSKLPIEGAYRGNGWRDGLAEICGMSGRAVSRVLAELAAQGYDMRAPVTDRNGRPVRDKRGRLVYAAKNHAVSLVVPWLAPRGEPQRSPEVASNGAQPAIIPGEWESLPDLASIEPQRSPLLVPKVAESGDPVPSVSPESQNRPQAAAPRLAQDQPQGQSQGQDPRLRRPLTASPKPRARQGPGTVADDVPDFSFHNSESTTAGTGARARRSDAPAA
jgi:hypothetical protein